MPIKFDLGDNKLWGRWWSQPNLPTIFDDSLSYYEVLSGINALVVKLLKAMEEFDGVSTEELNLAVTQLQSAINTSGAALQASISSVKNDLDTLSNNTTTKIAALSGRVSQIENELNTAIEPEIENLKSSYIALSALVNKNYGEVQGQIEVITEDINNLSSSLQEFKLSVNKWINSQYNVKLSAFSPFTGRLLDYRRVMYELAQGERVNGMTAQEYDNKSWTAAEYDGMGWTAYYYDWDSNLVGGN